MTEVSAAQALSYRQLSVTFATDAGSVRAVDDVTFDVHPGEVLAVVGESGSGKSVSARAAIGLLPDTARVSGVVELGGRDVAGLSDKQFTALRGKDIAMVFQEPGAALDPLFTVGYQIAEAVRAHTDLDRGQARQRAIELLRMVRLPDPEHRVDYYPHQLSGGQKQRVVIACAIACEPAVIIADEPTTALDVTIQAQILDLLEQLQREQGMGLLLITHDLAVVSGMAQQVALMYAGQIVELAPAAQFFRQHCRDMGAKKRVAGHHRVHRPHQFHGGTGFEHESRDACPQGLLHHRHLRMGRKDQDFQLRPGLAEAKGQLHAVEPRHLDIDHRDIRPQCLDLGLNARHERLGGFVGGVEGAVALG